MCEARAYKKVRWPLCPARGGLDCGRKHWAPVPNAFGIGIGYFLGKQKVTSVTNRDMFGSRNPIVHVNLKTLVRKPVAWLCRVTTIQRPLAG